MEDEIINNLTKNMESKLKCFENDIFKEINDKYDSLTQIIYKQIDDCTNEVKNILFKKYEEELSKKVINIDELNIPPLVHLKLDNSNYLINLILLSLSHFKRLTKYLLWSYNRDNILSKLNQDPTGIYITPSYFKLLDHIWKGTENTYSPNEIHEVLKKMMKNGYNSTNPGEIINFIISQLHKEFIKDNILINDPEWNFNDNQAMKNFVDYFLIIHNKISEEFFASIRIKKLNQQNTPIYLYHNTIVLDIFLENLNVAQISLEQNFKSLFYDKNDTKKYCLNNETFHSKEIVTTSILLIININRKKNHKQILKYPKILDNYYLLRKKPNIPEIYNLYSVIMSKKENNNEIFYGYIKNCINNKWYLYDNKGIKLVNNENEIFDGEKCLLLIYHKQTE